LEVETAVRGLLGDDDVGTIDPQAPLMEMGLDSLASTELVRELSVRFELQLSETLLFNYPTVDALSAHVHSELGAPMPECDTEADESSYDEETKGLDENKGDDQAAHLAAMIEEEGEEEIVAVGSSRTQHVQAVSSEAATGVEERAARLNIIRTALREDAAHGLLVTLRRGDTSREPIVFVHGGTGWTYGTQVLHSLAAEQPVYCVQAVEFCGRTSPSTLSERIEGYCNALAAETPLGVHLVG
jgi:acyl carrier protein